MPQKVVTDKDKDILEALLRNTEIKFSVIAKKFGIPMSSVYRVYNKLRDMGILKGRLYIVDYSKIGLPILANFTIEISGDEKKVMEFLRHCENIEFCGKSINDSVIVAYGYFENRNELKEFEETIKKEFGVKRISVIEIEQKTKIQKQPLKCKTYKKEYVFKIIPR